MPGTVSEAEILNYADKRVMHDEIVILDRRMDYILDRYGETPAHRERIKMLWQKTKELEIKIFKDLPLTPDDLIRLIPHNGYAAELQKYQQFAHRI